MTSFSLGDLAQTYMFQRRGSALKAEMTRLNEELATGQVSDVKAVLAGNVSYLADIENDLRTLDAYSISGNEAAHFTDAVQTSLSRIDDGIGAIGTQMLTTAASAVGSVLTQMSDDAIVEMDAVLSAINTQSGGRSLFSGAATDGPAITTSDVILDAARTVLAGAQTPEEIITALDDWFDDPNGFRQTAYLGSDADLAGFRVADGETVDLALSADDAVFADILKPLVLAAVTSDDTFDLAPEDKRALLSDAGQNILTAQSHLTTTQAQVGSVQARIDTFLTRNATEQTALEFAKGALLQADPYETATQLEAVQFQLQGLYTVTARTADLSLVNFIR